MKKLNILMGMCAFGLTGALAEPVAPKVAPVAPASLAPVKAIRASAASLPDGITLREGTLTLAEGLKITQVSDSRISVTGLFGKKKPKPKPDTVDFWCSCFDGAQGNCSLSVQGQTATCGGDACCSMMTSPAVLSVDAPVAQ